MKTSVYFTVSTIEGAIKKLGTMLIAPTKADHVQFAVVGWSQEHIHRYVSPLVTALTEQGISVMFSREASLADAENTIRLFAKQPIPRRGRVNRALSFDEFMSFQGGAA